MRKFLLIAMVMFTLPMFAQNYTMRMANIFSEDGAEAWDYVYTDTINTSLVCINEHDFLTPTECIDSIFLDERGNITKLATWQEVEGQWVAACYVEYTYDERDLRTSRTNYNNFGYGWELGGVYTYNYDEEGRMIEWALEFIIPEYQKAIIEYDENGLKTAETIQQYNFSTYYMEPSFSTDYEYDENGNCVREEEFAYEAEVWTPKIVRVYEYDENGNCVIAEKRTPTGTVQEKQVYTYDTSISAENVYYYENPEDDYPQLPKVKANLLKKFEFYAQNDESALTYVTTYHLNYESCGSGTDAVEEVEFNSNIYPNPAQDYVMVESSEADYVEVVDVFGRVVFATEMSETVKVDMSEFASGIYFVKLQANGATSVQKIMKK